MDTDTKQLTWDDDGQDTIKGHSSQDDESESIDDKDKENKDKEDSGAGGVVRSGEKEKRERAGNMTLMEKYVGKSAPFPDLGDVVEGTVITVDSPRSELYVDLKPFGTGLIYGREFMVARDIIKKVNPGDVITAKVVGQENEDGYIELSLKEARAALVWSEAEKLSENEEILRLVVRDANKGGLIIDWKGIQGFLPASQLGAEHYPRVENGDKHKIMEELKKLIGERISVSVLTAVPKESKLIFTEKGFRQEEREEIVEKYAIGDEIEGEVTGIVDFGVFVKIEDGLEGLVHISELDWGLVENPRRIFKVKQKIRGKIIDIQGGKISLSVKALKENPWNATKDKYKKDDEVKGVIIKYNKYGALASVEEGVAGLVHVSEFGSEEKLRDALELGKVYSFRITHFDQKEQKMTLSHKKAGETV